MGARKRKVEILNNFDGIIEPGEMLVVLGPPGSGCSTLLKTIAGETHGIYLDEASKLNYRGISPEQMHSNFKGEAIYSAEVDVHFPSLTVGDTLTFAANARAPRTPPAGLKQKEYAQHMAHVVMALFGISHTVNTKVGNDFVRGVSGGERKRVSIAEALLAGSPLQCWDNSTRGLDSANAVEFCKTLRMSTEMVGCTAVVAIYQAPQDAYDVFDKVVLLYEGEQIFFGSTREAKQFFLDMGFVCPEQQTTPDFLTSLTSPAERQAKEGMEHQVPKTAKEFAAAWRASPQYKALRAQLDGYDAKYPIGGEHLEAFQKSRRAQQSKHINAKSSYTLSFRGQVGLCLRRGFQRLKADPSLTVFQLFGNFVMGLVVSSVFFNMAQTTSTFYQRGAVIFFALLLNAFGSALEILTLYAQRPIVEKQSRYGFYHPSAEAVASMLTDMPYKIVNAIIFNLVIYFMANLRRDPGHFFFFLLINFFATLEMSMVFRSMAALSRTLVQALAPAAVLLLALVIYTGFALTVPYMPGWSRWINYLDPLAYAFESLMVNEFHDQDFTCNQLVPQGPGYGTLASQVCSTTGAVAGQDFVNGDNYINTSYQYFHAHKWRNFGILIAFIIFQCSVYIIASEYISEKKSKGEVLVFPRGQIPKELKVAQAADEENGAGDRATVGEKLQGKQEGAAQNASMIKRQTAVFQWQDVVYDIKIKGEPRRILDHVDGWVKPGQMTALMGVSGAGKTTLLDCLATRVTMGVVTGEMLVDGRQRDQSFQRKTGYVQQQDLHLATSTVREALRFSALLRQPAHIPKEEKLQYVEQVLELLEMMPYADAVIGVPGVGLNVEQRKRTTIGVELVAKPDLLLFLDEPTSGLDSQTSWSIIELLDKLRKHGQAILCTIHQPSAILFERFDRLLFLAKGGRTIYFGPMGKQSSTLIEYFEHNGGPKYPKGANPAEWMLSVIGAAPGSHTDVDWHQTWLDSKERTEVREELATMKRELSQKVAEKEDDPKIEKAQYREFAAPIGVQFRLVLERVFAQYWRTPSYIFSKFFLTVASALFIGFSFYNMPLSQQGVQNQLFAVFMLFIMFGQICQQIMPNFVTQRSLYEVRERPAKTYSWKVFMISNILVELPWNSLCAVLVFFCWYYPIGMYKNAFPTHQVNQRGVLVFLFVWTFLLFSSTFANMAIAGIDTAENGANIANLIFSLCLIFCGVLAPPGSFPGFWIFMYRVSPFTYLVGGILGTGLSNTLITCADNEYLRVTAPGGQTCIQYFQNYINSAGGYLLDEQATNCEYCAVRDSNVLLEQFNIRYSDRWRNFGIMWAFIIFNIFAAIFLYWLARVPKGHKVKEEATPESSDKVEPVEKGEKAKGAPENKP